MIAICSPSDSQSSSLWPAKTSSRLLAFNVRPWSGLHDVALGMRNYLVITVVAIMLALFAYSIWVSPG
jgi:hypothetical protein